MQIRVCGAMSVRAGTVLLDSSRFPGPQSRLIFACLAWEHPRAVPRDELADALWGEGLPPTWDKSLGMIVSRLRNALGEAGVAITSASGCYQLRLPDEAEIDIARATRDVVEAEHALAQDPERAAAMSRTAATVAREPVLPGEDSVWAERKRQEVRGLLVRALDVLAEASLRRRDHAEAIRAAEEMTAIEPYRETGYVVLMRALAAAGNRAEALRAFERCRSLLAEELGVDPSPQTTDLFTALLRGDDEAATASAPRTGDAAQPRKTGRRLFRAAIACGAALAVAASAAVYAVIPRGLRSVPPQGVASIDASGHIVAALPFAVAHRGIAQGGGSVWVAGEDGSLSRIDERTSRLVQTIALGSEPAGVAFGGGDVWVSLEGSGAVARIDPEANRVVQTIATGNGPDAIVAAGSDVWVANEVDGTVSRIDALSGAVANAFRSDAAANALAVAANSLWVADRTSASVLRLDIPTTRFIQRVNVGNGPAALATSGGDVWVANELDGTVTKIDAVSGAVVATVRVGTDPTALSASAGRVWVACRDDATVTELDAGSARVLRTVRVASEPEAVVALGRSTWIAAGPPAGGHLGGTLVVATSEKQPSIDPGVSYSLAGLEITSLTHDGLVGYARREGNAGTAIVPDLAMSLPAVTDDGLTYTFRLRQGIEYSNGAPVRASDFRSSMERLFRLGSDGAPYFSSIVGASTCTPRACDLSKGILTDDRSATVTFRLSAEDPEFLPKLTQPFADVVAAGAGPAPGAPPPGTGPYMAVVIAPDRIELARNPHFRVWSALAQPPGRPDRIVYRLAMTSDAQVRAVESGSVDLTTEFLRADQAQTVVSRYADRAHAYPVQATFAIFFDTRVPPFNDARVRRALAYAIDRDRVVQLFGGPFAATTTCQMLPPGFPGYRPYCPFTAAPDASNRWRAPDIATAHALVAASGNAGTRVTFESRPDLTALSDYVAGVLRQLGYPTTVRHGLTHDQYVAREIDPKTMDQLTMFNWLPDFVAPSEFISVLFTCPSPGAAGGRLSQFCDRDFDRRVAAAERLEAGDPANALPAWSALDRRITDLAPAVPVVTPRGLDFSSARLGNYESTGTGLRLVDEMWVR